jgi:hypothetical protein
MIEHNHLTLALEELRQELRYVERQIALWPESKANSRDYLIGKKYGLERAIGLLARRLADLTEQRRSLS